jgi:hypothetical protein
MYLKSDGWRAVYKCDACGEVYKYDLFAIKATPKDYCFTCAGIWVRFWNKVLPSEVNR